MGIDNSFSMFPTALRSCCFSLISEGLARLKRISRTKASLAYALGAEDPDHETQINRIPNHNPTRATNDIILAAPRR